MAKSKRGNPAVDGAAKVLLRHLKKFSGRTASNLTSQLLGELIAETFRVAGIVTQHRSVKLQQEMGGNKSAVKKRSSGTTQPSLF